jgi:hypothetical protein
MAAALSSGMVRQSATVVVDTASVAGSRSWRERVGDRRVVSLICAGW